MRGRKSASRRTAIGVVKQHRRNTRELIYMQVARTCIIFAGCSSYPDEWTARAVLDDAIDRLMRLRARANRRDREHIEFMVKSINETRRVLRDLASKRRARGER